MSQSRNANLKKFLQSDGRTVILPIDHGTAIPVPGMERPVDLVESIRDHVDGFVVNLGVALACNAADAFGDSAVCLRADCYKPTHPGNADEGAFRLYGPDEAEAVGAHAMMNMLYVHHSNEADNFRECSELISESLEADLPIIVETLPFNIGRPDDYTVENIGFAARVAAELGADVVKTAFPTGADTDDFRKIVDATFVPVIVLGGAAMGDDRALLGMVKSSVDAGAAGIAVGRNVWQHPQPVKIAAALNAIVHDNATVDSALKLITS